jgi:Predicted transcriptional regulators
MVFNHNKSIFIQIASLICKRVLDGIYLPDNRIPSVRELAVEVEVNPNTVMRSFERLQGEGIIYNKRGVGYFISPDAPEKIHLQRHDTFMKEELPEMFKEMALLNISIEDLIESYKVFLSNETNNKNENK